MTILETITATTFLIIGLVASVAFYRQIDCYHALTVQAVELRLRPLEHDEKTTQSFNTQCKGHINRRGQQVFVQFNTHRFDLSLPLEGKL